MATTRITTALPPNIDITKAELAYGSRMLQKLNRQLRDPELLTRQRALNALCDVLHNPEHISAGLQEGIAGSLKDLLGDADGTVRWRATEVIFIISNHAIGRDAILKHDLIKPISVLFDDDHEDAKLMAHKAMESVSHTIDGANGIVSCCLVAKLVEKLQIESDDIKELILDTLHYCMKINTSQALSSKAINVFSDLLENNKWEIRSKAARDVMDITFPLQGKQEAVEVGCIPTLVNLLSDEIFHVRAHAAGALMSITITTDGKVEALKSGAVRALMNLIQSDEHTEVRLNAIKAITTLSEHPEGREELKQVVPLLEKISSTGGPIMHKVASTAIKVITWKP